MRIKIDILYLLFLLCIFFLANAEPACAQAPTVQDCLGAIPVCNTSYSTIQSYTGHGNVYPEIHDNSVCPLCMDGEKNDVFYVITVQTAGMLRFILTPNNLNNDYDWAVFNMTNADCSQLYPNAVELQVSCNSYGVTGQNGATGASSLMGGTSNCGGPGVSGLKWNKDIPVLPGETYLINISNWSSTSQSGYTLDFSSSTAVVTDNVDPFLLGTQESILCSGTTNITFSFSENVLCTDVQHHPEKFHLVGPDGPVTVTDVLSADCATGGHHSKNFVLQVNPAVFEGDYELNVIGQVRDLCTNEAGSEIKSFHLHETNSPSADAGDDKTIPYGAYTTLQGSGSGGSGSFSYHWEPAALLVDPDVSEPTTVGMSQTTIFTLTVTDNTGGCNATDDALVTITGGPLNITATADPETICMGLSTQLHSLGGGGSGSYTYSWTSDPPGFTSTIPDPVVTPAVTTVYHVLIQDGYSTSNASVTVTVHPRPVANAGTGTSIPYGTTTTLHASANGGSGNYTWLWTSNPPGFTSTLKDPVTPQLQVTTLFSLWATDVTTGCESASPAQVTVIVTGGPLNTNPVATPSEICLGESSELNGLAGGGSGNYTYSWTSDPPGFTSSSPNPSVQPATTTLYSLAVNDGYNTANGQVNVIVDPVPVVSLGPSDTVVCVYDSLTLDAGNPGSTYLWSNGSTDRQIRIGTSGIGFDEQVFRVSVTNPMNCTDSSSIRIIFSFLACTGVNENAGESGVILSPNPASSHLVLEFSQSYGNLSYHIYDNTGRSRKSGCLNQVEKDERKILDVSDFSSGIYVVCLENQKGFLMSSKFMIWKN